MTRLILSPKDNINKIELAAIRKARAAQLSKKKNGSDGTHR